MICCLSLILAIFVNTPKPPQPPQGYLDCGFTQENVYKCKP